MSTPALNPLAGRWKLLLGLLLGMVATVASASESVSIAVTSPYAYESDPVNGYGEVQIRRTVAAGTPLQVRFVVGGIIASQQGQPIRGTAASGSAADYDIPGFAPPATYGAVEIATIPAGQSFISLKVVPHADTDQLKQYGELNEFVTFQLQSDGQSGLSYTVTDLQIKQVNIIDADIDAQAVNLGNIAEKIGADVNGNNLALGFLNNIRIQFPNSTVLGGPGTVTSFSPYATLSQLAADGTLQGRYVELLRGGTATLNGDYTMTYHIGGNTGAANDLLDGEPILQPYAYRLRSENGSDLLSNGTNSLHRIVEPSGFLEIDVAALNLPAVYYNLRIITSDGTVPNSSWGVNHTFPGYEKTPGDGIGHALTDESFWGDLDANNIISTSGTVPTITGNQIKKVVVNGTRNTITLTYPITADIEQAVLTPGGAIALLATFKIAYETVTRDVQPKVVVTGTPPNQTTTTTNVTTIVPFTNNVDAKVNENVIYPPGACTVSIQHASGVPGLYVGDVFSFSNDPTQRYRVTGPTPHSPFSGAAEAGWPVNKDNLVVQSYAVGSIGKSNDTASFVSFWPPLQKAILRDQEQVKLTSTYTPTFTNNRTVIHIPALPTPDNVSTGLPYQLTYDDITLTSTALTWPTHELDNGGLPNDMPTGDWIDFTCSALDDTAVEGAETITMTVQTSNANNGYAVLNPGVVSMVLADNDSVASVAVTQPCYEGGSPGKFLVSFTAAFPRDVLVPYVLQSDGSGAFANWDLNLPNAYNRTDIRVDGLSEPSTSRGVVVLPAGQKSIEIQVQANADTVEEGPELVRLQLVDSEDYVLASSTDSSQNASAATMTVSDLVGTLGVTATVASTAESTVTPVDGMVTFDLVRNADTSSQTATVTVKFSLGGVAIPNVDYQIVFPTGTTGTIDYASASGTIIMSGAPQVNQVSFLIRPLDDVLVEGPESVIVSVVANGYTPSPTTSTAQVTIVDDEPQIMVQFVDDASEPATSGHFRVYYAGLPAGTALNRPITVFYTVSGTAGAGTDYTALSGSVTIPAGNTSKLISVDPVEDQVTDPGETVIVTLTPNAAYTLDTVTPANSTASLSIGETRTAQGTVSVVRTSADVLEASSPTRGGFFVKADLLSASATHAFTVPLAASGTATPTLDYNPLLSSVSFPTQPSLIIDGTPVAGSTIVLRSAIGSQLLYPGARLDIGGVSTTAPAIRVAAAAAAGDAALLLQTDTGSVTIKSGTALIVGGRPYTTTANATVTTTPNLVATSAVPLLGAELNDPVAISLATDSAHAVTVVLPVAVPAVSPVTLLTQAVYVQVLPVDDQIVEGDETVVLTMGDGLWYDTSSANSATVTITDDEPTLRIDPVNDASEPTTVGHFVVSYPGVPLGIPLTRALTVAYTVSTASTATAGVDYVTLSGTLSIPAGSLSGQINVTPIIDIISDPDETVVVDLSASAGNAYQLSGATSATVFIGETSTPQGDLGIFNGASALEGTPGVRGSFFVILERTSVADTLAANAPLTYGGGAFAGVDYQVLPASVSFPAQPSLTWVGAVAGSSTFTLRASGSAQVLAPLARLSAGGTALTMPNISVSSAAAPGATAISLKTASGSVAIKAGTVLIIDGRQFTLAADTTITTAAAAVTVTPAVSTATALGGIAAGATAAITLRTDTSHDVTVTTATAIPATAATISLLTQVAYLPVIPNDDAISESTENVIATLSPGLYYNLPTGSDSAAVSILDDEPPVVSTVGFALSTYSTVVDTAATTALITVKRTQTAGAVSVTWSTIAGTAVAGVDFIAATGTLSWANGDNADKSFTVTIPGQAPGQAEKRFTVQLSGPVGTVAIGGTNPATVRVIFPVDTSRANNSVSNQGDSGGGCGAGSGIGLVLLFSLLLVGLRTRTRGRK